MRVLATDCHQSHCFCRQLALRQQPPFAGKFLDLIMLLIPGGKERTEAEYRALFNEAGFELSRIVPTNTELSIVEGVKQ